MMPRHIPDHYSFDYNETMHKEDLQRSLIKTIEKCLPRQAKALLEEGTDVNWRDPTGQTPLMTAAFYGELEMVELLLEHGAEIGAFDHLGLGVLHHSFRLDQPANTKCLQLLLWQGAGVNAQDHKGQTPLWTALAVSLEYVENNSTSIHALLDAGADIFIPTHKGKTPHDLLRENSNTPWTYKAVADRINAIHEDARMKRDTNQPSGMTRPALRI